MTHLEELVAKLFDRACASGVPPELSAQRSEFVTAVAQGLEPLLKLLERQLGDVSKQAGKISESLMRRITTGE